MTAGQTQHEMLVESTHDEYARQSYIADLRFHLLNDVAGGMKDVYDQGLKQRFIDRNGREPADKREVHQLMMQNHYTRTWSSMMRSCQEMMWDSVIPSIDRQRPELTNKLKQTTSNHSTVELNPDVEVPRYVKAVDIHCMPGGYHFQTDEDDITQAALYDRGVYIYQMGFAGGLADGIGRSVAQFIRQRYPDLEPQKILDVGCTVGHNTGPFCEVFPNADVHAIDCCPGLLKYAQARAESLQLSVHFEQMDARRMSYPDNSFDIVFSCILFHETTRDSHRQILEEARRVLKPGGININMELPPNENLDAYSGFQIDWDAYYNNEPYYAASTSTDVIKLMQEVGFAEDQVFEWLIPDYYEADRAQFDEAVRAHEHSYTETGRWGEVVRWYGYGARK